VRIVPPGASRERSSGIGWHGLVGDLQGIPGRPLPGRSGCGAPPVPGSTSAWARWTRPAPLPVRPRPEKAPSVSKDGDATYRW
jgi:hypothetical protein